MSYDSKFYDAVNNGSGASAGSLRSALEIVPVVVDLLHPRSVLDVGCGEGAWLSVFAAHRCDVLGMDGDYVDASRLLIPEHRFRPADLSTAPLVWDQPYPFDLAMSVEVAEHLPRRAADGFVSGLCRAAQVVLFSGAIPGQGGLHHVNEQWPGYWVEKFEANDFKVSGALRWQFWDNPNVDYWFRENLLLCMHRDLDLLPEIMSGPMSPPWPVVHPVLWEWTMHLPWDVPEDQVE